MDWDWCCRWSWSLRRLVHGGGRAGWGGVRREFVDRDVDIVGSGFGFDSRRDVGHVDVCCHLLDLGSTFGRRKTGTSGGAGTCAPRPLHRRPVPVCIGSVFELGQADDTRTERLGIARVLEHAARVRQLVGGGEEVAARDAVDVPERGVVERASRLVEVQKVELGSEAADGEGVDYDGVCRPARGGQRVNEQRGQDAGVEG